MSKPKAPSPPDPATTAAAQSAANVSTAAAQAAMNNVDQYSPYGSTIFNQNGSYTAPNGDTVPTYSQTTNLSPLGNEILNGQQQYDASVMPVAQRLLGYVGYNPIQQNTVFSKTLGQGPQLLDQNTVNAIYGQQKSFLDPQWNLQQTQLQDQLARQGIGVGSDAYNSAMQNFNNSKTQAYQSAQDSAIGQGTQAAGNLFNMALAGQQQNIAQQENAQQFPLQQLQALLGTALPTGSQPLTQAPQTNIAPTDVVGAQGLATNAGLADYQAQVSNQNADIGGLASIAAVAAIAI